PLHEAELRRDRAIALARRACALAIGAEEGGLDVVRLRERLADGFEQAGVGGRVAARGTLDRPLIDEDDALAAHKRCRERALPRPRDAREGDEHARRNVDVDIAEIVLVRSADPDGTGRDAQ